MDYIILYNKGRVSIYLFVDNNSLCMYCVYDVFVDFGVGEDPKSEYINRSIYYCIFVNIGLKQQAK